MEDFLNSKGLCHVCRTEMTTISAEATPGTSVFVCEKCLETAKQNFIWICVGCGSVFIRPKSVVLARLRDPGLKKAFMQCEGLQIIQGIDQCIECAPAEVLEFTTAAKREKCGGNC